jgi:hypothetical protein
MKIGFITTINTNIGDDFIRTGIENILESVKGKKTIDYTYVNKHLPDTAITPNSPWHWLNKLPNFKGKGRLYNFYYKYLHAHFNVYKNQDLIIQSGAPVLWPDCQNNEWAQPIWYNIIGKLKDKIPVVNLAAGSCYPWENKETFSSKEEAVYAKDIGGFCKLTTTRDTLANKLFSSVGVDNILMPCTAFFVSNKFENENAGKYILINYMKGGGHFDWDQKVDAQLWETTMKNVVTQLSLKHEVHFICHNEEEIKLAAEIFPGMPVHYPKTVAEYLACIEHAKLGINNRMHASVAMASVGVPAISVCTDTRLLMLENIGLPIFYVKDAFEDRLMQTAVNLLEKGEEERARLFKLKKEKFSGYQELLRPFVG